MSDRLFSKIIAKSAGGYSSMARPDDSEGVENLGTFGWLRSQRDSPWMLELRKSNGDCFAIGYSWLDRVGFNPSNGISLHYGGRVVRIAGTYLNSPVASTGGLFEGIACHRVQWVQEADLATAMLAAESDTIVKTIEW